MRNNQNDFILSSSSIAKTNVRNTNGEDIGKIEDLMIDTDSGEVVYAVLSVNTGFLNLGSKYFAIPLQVFDFDTQNEEVVLNIDKERLENSPGFDKDNWPSGPQHDFIDEVNTFYGNNARVQEEYVSANVEMDNRQNRATDMPMGGERLGTGAGRSGSENLGGVDSRINKDTRTSEPRDFGERRSGNNPLRDIEGPER